MNCKIIDKEISLQVIFLIDKKRF